MWCVYVHTLKCNPKKIYIGITGREPESRWKQDGSGYKCGYFKNAISKYGFDAFTHTVLVENISKEMAEIVEIELIKNLKLQGYELYNICSGGQISDGRKGHHNTPEHNKRISQANSGRKSTPEQIEASRQRMLARKAGWYSKPGAKSPLCNRRGVLNCRAHKVYAFDLDWNLLNQFDTIKDASEFYNIGSSAISACCRGRLNKTHNYRFSYEEVDARAIS